ncbi:MULTISPECIES: thiolase family protein [Mycobacteriales]|jgi:acetyl-CoA acyltransferase|uniref:thiolase family protein n=1 Tax=Mycobacteriales TaxID=85007 RepID=UPI000804C811|nr:MULTISPECIES: thiolase family protein [Mycobacteriales]OAV78236.1 thiolase [Dietzia sp. 111N12-1]QMU23458.1 thiolase family protein [Gordonia rubripertincta]QXU56555.1 thiolase family protein [Rhodococcus sp. LW-XY12]USX48024.1 thiolase family protein [Dietzia kunjamensis]
MSNNVWIVGIGMTTFGKHTDSSVHDLAGSAITDALDDAGLGPCAVDAAFYGTATHGPLEGQAMISGEIALRELGIQRIPVFNVENACATGASAFALATAYIKAGEADVVLAAGAEKMNVGDPELTMSVFDMGYDVARPKALQTTLDALGGEIDEPDLGKRSIFMDIYAAMARSHMRQHGTTQEQIAAVAAKNHAHSIENERAHYRKALTVDEVLQARPLSFPLTVPMCAPVTDGAAAVIVCSDAGLSKLSDARPVQVLASVVGTGSDRDITTFDGHLSQGIADLAYKRARITPDQVDVAEVHDATAFAEILQTEMLGLVAPGEGGAAAANGETTLGGRIPVNPSGGLESKGHPIGASGLAQIFELTQQLRGECGPRQVAGARIALAENGGGFHRGEEAVTAITILKGAQ